MNSEQLRSLVREEVQKTLDEELTIDSHLKFRRLVEYQVGHELGEETYDITFQAWTDVVRESSYDNVIDGDLVERYVNEAVEGIKELEELEF